MTTVPQTLGQMESRLVEQRTGIRIPDDPRRRSRLQLRLAQSWARPGLPAWDAGRGVCKVCAKAFCAPGEDATHVSLFGTTVEILTTVCDECGPIVSEHYATAAPSDADSEVTLTPNWDEKCPPRFKSAILGEALPAGIDRATFERITRWRYTEGGKGLYIHGPAGTGKTTSFWALARVLEKESTAPFVLTSLELSRQLQEAARDIRAVPWLARARVLMIDDFGKERATPAAAALLWEVLDQRYSHGLPVIITSRFTSKELAERFGEASIGEDITRRLYELCEGVKFAGMMEKTP